MVLSRAANAGSSAKMANLIQRRQFGTRVTRGVGLVEVNVGRPQAVKSQSTICQSAIVLAMAAGENEISRTHSPHKDMVPTLYGSSLTEC